jgi:hypothetical protein
MTMPSKTKAKQRRTGRPHALDALENAAAQYAEYVRIANVTALPRHDETWTHDPSTPLSLELYRPR